MRRPASEPSEILFDLPLERPDRSVPAEPAAASPPTETAAGTEPETALDATPDQTRLPLDSAAREESFGAPDDKAAAALSLGARRVRAGALDAGVHLGVLVAAVLGTLALGARLDAGALAPFALLAAAFSFVYFVLPLTFWGRTPGMARFALTARAAGGVRLTIGQAVRRWLGAALTVLGLGLPLALLATNGRSLADRLSATSIGS